MVVCIFGDSIAWGSFDPNNGGWATQLRNFYEKLTNVDVEIYNLGISGDTTTKMLKRIDVEIFARSPEHIIFAIGINDAKFDRATNDARTPKVQFEENLLKLVSIGQKAKAKITFIGLTHVDEEKISKESWGTEDFYANNQIEAFDAVIEKTCKKYKLQYISMRGVIEDTDLEDGLHPNTQGHLKMFKKVQSEISFQLLP